MAENLRARLQGEVQALHYTFRGQRKGGLTIDVEVYGTKMEFRGKPAVIGTLLDITERKQMEEALRESESKSRTVADFTWDWEFWLNPDQQFIYVSPSCERISGYTREAFIESSTLFLDIVHPEDAEAMRVQLAKAFSQATETGFDFRIIRRDSQSCWASMAFQPITGADGAFLGVRGSLRDITERVWAEEAVRESEKRFRSLFEDSPISLWEEDFSLVAAYTDELRHSGITDFRAYFEDHPEAVDQCAAMAKVVDVNKATLRLYKAKSKEDLLAGLNLVLSEEGFSTFREELIALAEGRTKFEDEVVNRTLTGEKIHLALGWSVAPGHEKTYSVVFVSIDDITERKRAEEKLAVTVTELIQRNNEVTLLNEMGDLLQTCHTVEEASAVVAQFARKLFPNQSGALCLIAASRNLVEAVATWGKASPQERVFTPDDCWALRRGQTHSVTDPRSGLLCKHVSQPVRSGYMCIPMMAQGETLGVLHLQSGQPGAGQTTDEQAATMASQGQLALTLVEHVALALANLKLRETLRQQAIRDPLTALFNRRYLEETFERELRRAERRQAPLGVVMLDLDHFKRFNDTFGHAAGDVVLREIGTFLQTHIRAEDIACRYGGEEFLVIFPEASLDDTLKRAEQLREGTKQLQVRHHDQTLGTVTASLGVAAFPEHGSTAEAILQAADAAMYAAKKAGRNRVEVMK